MIRRTFPFDWIYSAAKCLVSPYFLHWVPFGGRCPGRHGFYPLAVQADRSISPRPGALQWAASDVNCEGAEFFRQKWLWRFSFHYVLHGPTCLSQSISLCFSLRADFRDVSNFLAHQLRIIDGKTNVDAINLPIEENIKQADHLFLPRKAISQKCTTSPSIRCLQMRRAKWYSRSRFPSLQSKEHKFKRVCDFCKTRTKDHFVIQQQRILHLARSDVSVLNKFRQSSGKIDALPLALCLSDGFSATSPSQLGHILVSLWFNIHSAPCIHLNTTANIERMSKNEAASGNKQRLFKLIRRAQ